MPMLLPLEIVADAVWEREMTTAAENELLTGVGAGTPMGGLMRQYWVPALMSSELKADGDPVRLMLLGEKLIAFRDSNGKVGIMDHRCPHRCASLFFGRNEDGGIRCVYHGWKFDADGNCTDMANVPPHQDFKHKVHAKAYKTAELNGLVWVFMGDQRNVPPLPRIEAALMPEDELDLTCFLRECNWLQALEGDIDTSHADFLHGGTRQAQDFAADDIRRFGSIHRDPDYAVADTDCGTMYGAYRPAGAGQQYWRIAHFMMPFWTITPAGPFERHVTARAWVPVDDNHTMAFNLRQRGRLGGVGGRRIGASAEVRYLPNTSDWLGRWRLAEDARNDYGIDRAAQANSIYSGVMGVTLQDQMITESMGTVSDRTFEHLAPSDEMIARTRRRLVRAAQVFAKDGTRPPGADDPNHYFAARGGYYAQPADADWLEFYRRQLAAVRDPARGSRDAG
jgi:nitrite reductase/ring-hydroxylating ferredoxin subunit